MPPTVANFLKLRPILREVREQYDGWIFALYDYRAGDAEAIALLTQLHNDGVISELRQNGSLIFPSGIGSSCALELRIDTGKLPNYFETYNSLIKSNPDTFPNEFVVWEKNGKLNDGYKAACELIQFLKLKVEVWDTTGQRFFLVDQQAVEVPLTSYSAHQTGNLPVCLVTLVRFLDNAHLDADARWAFFRKASLRLLRELPKETRLGVLMDNLGNVLERAKQDYSLYLERFSFEDLLKNFDEKRLKFVGDLNLILSSIQTAIIAVPIGFFLIAEKFKPADGWIGQNIVIAAGGIVFFALVFVLTLNQGKTLQAIKLALIDFETEQKNKVTEKFERLQNLLKSTWSQYQRVKCLLRVVRILLIIFSVIIVLALIWCSIPAWQSFLPYAPKELVTPTCKTFPNDFIATTATSGLTTPTTNYSGELFLK